MQPKRILKKTALALASVAVFLALAEVVARLAEPGPFSLFDTYPYVFDARYQHSVHRRDFRGFYDGTWYELGPRGARGPGLEPGLERGPDAYRVLCLGDSCTFGKGVLETQTWPRQLEAGLARELEPERTPLVANLGVNGFSGAHYLLSLRDNLDLEPDLVVVGYNLNDFPNVVRAVDEAIYNRRRLRTLIPQGLRDTMGRSALYRWARNTFYALNRDRDWADAERFARGSGGNDDAQDPAVAEVWREQERTLTELARLAREAGAEVVVFLFPYESQVYADFHDETPIRRLREIAERADMTFVDLAERFRAHAHETDPPRRLFLRGDRYHPTAEGYGVVAGEVLRVARERGWLDEAAEEER